MILHLLIFLVTVVIYQSLIYLTANWCEQQIIGNVVIFKELLLDNSIVVKVILTVFLFSFIEYAVIIINGYRKGRAAIAGGLFYCNSNANSNSRKKSDKFLTKTSLSDSCHEILILGATGYETFGRKGSPLYDAFKKVTTLKIILIHPFSHAIDRRVADIGDQHTSVEIYKREILSSLKYLHKLKDERGDNVDIQVKLYKNYPFWKYVFLVDDYVWVQQYPTDDHVKYSPCYAFEKPIRGNNELVLDQFYRIINNIRIFFGANISEEFKVKKKGIYHQMKAQFYKRWNSHRLGVYDFANQQIIYYDKSGDIEDKTPLSL